MHSPLKPSSDTITDLQRRIYDITNVLEGIGLIEKNSKNMIKWKGDGPKSNSIEMAGKLATIRKELQDLEAEENRLDEQQASLEMSLKALASEGSHNAELAYLTSADLKAIPYFIGH